VGDECACDSCIHISWHSCFDSLHLLESSDFLWIFALVIDSIASLGTNGNLWAEISDEIQKIKAMKRKVKDLIWEIIFVLFLLAIGLTFVISGVWNILDYFQGSSKDVATEIMSGATVLLGLMILSIFIAGKFSGKLSHIWAEWVIWSLVVVMGLLFFWGLDIVITKPAQMWVSSGVENSSPVFWLIASPAFIILLIWARKSTLKNTGGILTFVELAEEGKKKKTKNRKVKLDGK